MNGLTLEYPATNLHMTKFFLFSVFLLLKRWEPDMQISGGIL